MVTSVLSFRRIAVGLLLVGLATWSAGCRSDQCASDKDCFKGQRCQALTGECVPVDAGAPDTAAQDTSSGDTTPMDADGASADADVSTPEDGDGDRGDADTGDVRDGTSDTDGGPICTGTGMTDPGAAEEVKTSSSLELWLRADADVEAEEMTNRVVTWGDQSNEGHAFEGPQTEGLRPILRKSGIHGNGEHPYLEFTGKPTGSNQGTRLDPVDGEPVTTREATIFLVVKNNEPDGGGALLANCSGLGNHQIRFGAKARQDNSPRKLYFYNHEHPAFGDGPVIEAQRESQRTDRWQVLTIVLEKTAITIRQNGSFFGEYDSGVDRSEVDQDDIWAFNKIGVRCSRSATDQEALEAGIAEVLLYRKRLSDARRCEIERALMRHYGLP